MRMFLEPGLPPPTSVTVHYSLLQQADTTICASSAAYCILLPLVKIQQVAGQQPTYDQHMTVSK